MSQLEKNVLFFLVGSLWMLVVLGNFTRSCDRNEVVEEIHTTCGDIDRPASEEEEE